MIGPSVPRSSCSPLFAVLAGAAPQRAHAAGSGLQVTIAARSCDRYTDIFANRARNNIMESLQDLGPDTPLRRRAADRSRRRRTSPQPSASRCPTGSSRSAPGYQTRAVTRPVGLALDRHEPVRDRRSRRRTRPRCSTTPGRHTGDTIAGATTIELTQDQANLAAQADSLWIQGGTPTDPILNQQYPGEYGFGALRCAIDNLNGDNVEWISFPAGPSTSSVTPTTSSRRRRAARSSCARRSTRRPARRRRRSPSRGNISFNADESFDARGRTRRARARRPSTAPRSPGRRRRGRSREQVPTAGR